MLTKPMRVYRLLRLLLLCAALSPQTGNAQVLEPDRWHLLSDPYLWTAKISGTAIIGDVTVPVDRGSDGVLGELAFFGNLFVEVGRNRWAGALEIGTASFDDSTVVDGAGLTPTTLGYGYEILLMRLIVAHRLTALDVPQGVRVFVGARYSSHKLEVSTPADPTDPDASYSEGWLDPIVGGRFHTPLPGNTFVTVGGDVGGFGIGSDFSWTTSGIIGWRFSQPVGVTLGYRYMSIDYKRPGSASSESFAYKGNQHGLMLGVVLIL